MQLFVHVQAVEGQASTPLSTHTVSVVETLLMEQAIDTTPPVAGEWV
jgi:hypothetical protein